MCALNDKLKTPYQLQNEHLVLLAHTPDKHGAVVTTEADHLLVTRHEGDVRHSSSMTSEQYGRAALNAREAEQLYRAIHAARAPTDEQRSTLGATRGMHIALNWNSRAPLKMPCTGQPSVEVQECHGTSRTLAAL